MGRVVAVDDRARLAALFREDAALYAYHLGDLDDFFWPRTRWWGLEAGGELREALLLYSGAGLPCLLAITRDPGAMREVVRAALPGLPAELYAHLTPGVEEAFAGWEATPHGAHLKMELVAPERLDAVETGDAVRLAPRDQAALLAFYARVYPGNFFDPRMLATGEYFALRADDGALRSVAGVHVVSREYRVAALGNITTRPDERGKGLARVVTAAVCRSLRAAGVETIGLNVLADNAPAIACYRRLGFTECAPYDEVTLRR